MRFFAAALIFSGVAASYGQTPEVPQRMTLAGMTLVIHNDARKEIQKDVDALTASPKYFDIKVERAKTYFPIIEQIFRDERVPDDLKYLVIQESALISDAVSVSDAVGFWQFKDFTAQEVGMRVDKEIDERMNIVSSSRGAARYLKQNNYFFNNWLLAVQAYQMGAGGVMRAVDEKYYGITKMEITSDTYWYVKKFLAHKIAFENALSGEPALRVTTVAGQSGKTLKEIAHDLSMEENDLVEYNKWMKGKRIPADREYAVLIPSGVITPSFTQLTLTTTPAVSQAQVPTKALGIAGTAKAFQVNDIPVIYANDGETLKQLANRSGVGLSAFLKFNEIFIDHKVRADIPYFLEKKKSKGEADFYSAGGGERLWEISQAYGVRVSKLVKYNRVAKDAVLSDKFPIWLSSKKPKEESLDETVVAQLGENTFNWSTTVATTANTVTPFEDSTEGPLANNIEAAIDEEELPVLQDEEKDVSAITYHEVVAADTLYGIARKYGVTINDVMKWNEKNDFTVSIGEKIKIIH